MKKYIREMDCAEIEAAVHDGADVNAVETYEHPYFEVPTTKSLLERAIELNCVETVQLLISSGADLHDEPYYDFDVKAQWRDRHIVSKTLQLAIVDDEMLNGNCYVFLWSSSFRSVPICKLLFEAYVVPQEEGLKKRTLLAAMKMVVEIGDVNLLDFLLARGGEEFINHQESFYTTPLHKACCYGDWEMVQRFLSAGAEVNVGIPAGDMPLTDAIYNGHEEIALVLIEKGADVRVRLKDRSTPLSMAKKKKMKRVVTAIEEILNQS